MCGNEVKEELLSPDGKMKLVVFSRDCGATTGFSTQASLLSANATLPNSPGNVFIIDDGDAAVSWENNSKISVLFLRGSHVFKQETLVRGVTIEYVKRKPSSLPGGEN